MSLTAGIRHRRLAAVIGGGIAAVLAVVATATATSADDAQAAGAAPSPVTDADIAEAGLAVMAFGLRNIGVDPITEACPVLTPDQLGWYFTQQGFTPNLTSFSVDTYYDDEVGDGYPGVDCLSDIEQAVDPDPAAPHYPVIGAAYLPTGITFADFLTGFEDQAILTPGVPGLGGEIGGVCIPSFCYLHWHRGSLVVSLLVAGGTGDITQAKTEATLTSMIPDVITNLIASMDRGMTAPGSTTTVAAPATTAVPATTDGAPTTTSALPQLPTPSVPEPTKTTAG